MLLINYILWCGAGSIPEGAGIFGQYMESILNHHSAILVLKGNSDWRTRLADNTSPLNWLDDCLSLFAVKLTWGQQSAVTPHSLRNIITSLLISKTSKEEATRFNVPIQRMNHFQQYIWLHSKAVYRNLAFNPDIFWIIIYLETIIV